MGKKTRLREESLRSKPGENILHLPADDSLSDVKVSSEEENLLWECRKREVSAQDSMKFEILETGSGTGIILRGAEN